MTAPDPRLDAIQSRLDAATPGPWIWEGGIVQDLTLAEQTGEHEWERVGIVPGEYVRDNDAEFIAAAPTDVSYLLAELRKAREALGRVEARADRLAKSKHCEDREIAEDLRAAVAAANGREHD